MLGGKGAEGQDVVGRVEEVGDDVDEAGLGELVGDVGQLAQVVSRSGCSKTERTKVAIIGQFPWRSVRRGWP